MPADGPYYRNFPAMGLVRKWNAIWITGPSTFAAAQ